MTPTFKTWMQSADRAKMYGPISTPYIPASGTAWNPGNIHPQTRRYEVPYPAEGATGTIPETVQLLSERPSEEVGKDTRWLAASSRGVVFLSLLRPTFDVLVHRAPRFRR